MINPIPLFGPVGPEVIVILLVLVLLFGANKIPKLARSTGQAMGEFKKGREEIEEDLKSINENETTEERESVFDDEESVFDEDDEVATAESTEKTN